MAVSTAVADTYIQYVQLSRGVGVACDVVSAWCEQCFEKQPFHWLSIEVGLHHACGRFLRQGAPFEHPLICVLSRH